MRITFEQACSLVDEMRAVDAQDAEVNPCGGSSSIVHVELSRDDEDTYAARGTITAAGTARMEALTTVVGHRIGSTGRVV
jgi:hypothetical protein